MKILKIRVRRDNFNTNIYPPGFLLINCLEHLYYDDPQTDICWLLVSVNDADVAKMTDLKDVTEITVAEAEAISNIYDPRKELITDEAKIRRLDIKARAGEKLNPADLKALDPNDPALGIGYEMRFIEKTKKRMGL